MSAHYCSLHITYRGRTDDEETDFLSTSSRASFEIITVTELQISLSFNYWPRSLCCVLEQDTINDLTEHHLELTKCSWRATQENLDLHPIQKKKQVTQ